MLAIVKSAANIRGPLLYNEQKVEQKQALFLDAHNFLLDKDNLSMRDKVDAFHHLTELNERSRQNIIHISVNFPDTDQLSDRQMTRIADDFMHGIGFGDQPWLAYRHLDAGHPHFHVVTTNIRPDGSRISNDLRSPNRLRKLCDRIEEKRHLTPAITGTDRPAIDRAPSVKGEYTGQRRAIYGDMPTSKQLGKILDYVNRNFNFTSFEAYNAILSLYLVRADRGREDGLMYRSGGLYYRMIDEEGKKIGAPVKASKFNIPVTLKKLERTFALNQERRNRQFLKHPNPLSRLTLQIDLALLGLGDVHYGLKFFAQDLGAANIRLVIPALLQRPTRQRKTPGSPVPSTAPDDGHGLFYVDLDSRTVIRDTELGFAYTGASILRQTGVEQELRRLYLENKLELPKNFRRQVFEHGYVNTIEMRNLLFRLSPQYDEICDHLTEENRLQQRLGHASRHSL